MTFLYFNMIMVKNTNMKIIYYIKKYKKIIDDFEFNLITASTSFYMIVAIFSLLILLIQFYNYMNNNNFIINKIIEIINPYYIQTFENIIPIFSLNSYSPILIINLVWSSSKYINGFNKASDIIYNVNKKRNYLSNRIGSILIFCLILSICFIEIITILYANKLITIIIKNKYLYMLIQVIVELILIFSVVLIINIYVPPVKRKIKDVYIGSIITTASIYMILILYIFIIKIYEKIFNELSVLFFISFSFLLVYFMNYCIVFGIYYNYYLQNKPPIYRLK